jgi:hypothetical protein
MLSFENVSNNPLIRQTDTDEKLKVFSYLECNESSDDVLKQSRGAIFDKDNNLLYTSFPYTTEIDVHDTEYIAELLNPIFDKCKVYKAYEGCLIRVFFYENKWYIATTRKLDAFKSKWAAKETFGTLFVEALRREMEVQGITDIDTLDWLFGQLEKDKQYMFLLQNSYDNRIVCTYLEPKVYHVGTIQGQNLVSLSSPLAIPFHEEIKCNDVSDLLTAVTNSCYSKLQGVVVFGPDNKQYKILNSTYAKYLSIRNNEPSVKFRYLQIRSNKEEVEVLKELYPEFRKDFDEYDDLIAQAAKSIHNSYVKRYIRGEFISVPQEEFAVMREAHEWHKKNIRYNRVNYDVILTFLNKGTPTNINRIIKHIKFGTTEKAQKIQEARRLLKVENETSV